MSNSKPESLGNFVRRIRAEKDLSLVDVERESARHGRRIVASYVNRIENDATRHPTADRLVALARGLGIPETELLAVAAGKIPLKRDAADELRLVAKFRELSAERRADVLKMIELWHSDEIARRRRRA